MLDVLFLGYERFCFVCILEKLKERESWSPLTLMPFAIRHADEDWVNPVLHSTVGHWSKARAIANWNQTGVEITYVKNFHKKYIDKFAKKTHQDFSFVFTLNNLPNYLEWNICLYFSRKTLSPKDATIHILKEFCVIQNHRIVGSTWTSRDWVQSPAK